MERKELKHNQIMRNLCVMPRKIVALHGDCNIPEYILHDLCHESCLNLSKAAYFIDNPDFDCFKGVAGFEQQACCCPPSEELWNNNNSLVHLMNDHDFNKRVQSIKHQSPHRMKKTDEETIDWIAHELNFGKPEYFSWQTKFDNHGLLVYERADENQDLVNEHMKNCVYFLSLCPVH